MLYKFKSKTCGDVIMLSAHGRRVLEILGKYDDSQDQQKGILLPEQMSAALDQLQQAISDEEAARAQAVSQAQVEKRPPPVFESLALRQRTLPLINMIKQSHRDEVPITWGV
jgi:hypothetical protein